MGVSERLGEISLPMLKDKFVFVREHCVRLVKRVSCFHCRQIMQMNSCKKVLEAFLCFYMCTNSPFFDGMFYQ